MKEATAKQSSALNGTTAGHSMRILSRRKREIPCKRGKRLNRYVDNLFRFAETSIIPNNLPMQLENITIDLPEYNLLVFLHSGMITRMEGIKRKGKAWVYCVNGTMSQTMSIGMPTKIQDMRITYRYRVIKDWHLVYDGSADVQVLKAKAQIQISQYMPTTFEESVQQRVEQMRIWSVGMVKVLLHGLGNLTSAVSMIVTAWLNNNLDYLFPMIKCQVENVAHERMNEFVSANNIPFDLVEAR